MDFWVDIAASVLLRLVKNKKQAAQYRAVLAKIFLAIRALADSDPLLEKEITERDTREV